MAKDYTQGDDYDLWYGTLAAPVAQQVWRRVPSVGDLAVDPGIADVEIPERGSTTGHLQGSSDPSITFTLLEDAGSADVTALIAAIHAGTMVHLAVARGLTKPYWHMECVLTGAPFSASRGEPAGYEVEAKRHAKSDYGLRRGTSFDDNETN